VNHADIRILVVDDQLHMRRMVRRMLIHLGYTTIEENDGKTVLQTLKLYRYHLVICDWQMEPTSGLEVLTFVRSDDGLRDTPFIMLTGENTSDAVQAAIKAGAQGYIAKPVSLQTLGSTIERVLGKAQGASASTNARVPKRVAGG